MSSSLDKFTSVRSLSTRDVSVLSITPLTHAVGEVLRSGQQAIGGLQIPANCSIAADKIPQPLRAAGLQVDIMIELDLHILLRPVGILLAIALGKYTQADVLVGVVQMAQQIPLAQYVTGAHVNIRGGDLLLDRLRFICSIPTGSMILSTGGVGPHIPAGRRGLITVFRGAVDIAAWHVTVFDQQYRLKAYALAERYLEYLADLTKLDYSDLCDIAHSLTMSHHRGLACDFAGTGYWSALASGSLESALIPNDSSYLIRGYIIDQVLSVYAGYAKEDIRIFHSKWLARVENIVASGSVGYLIDSPSIKHGLFLDNYGLLIGRVFADRFFSVSLSSLMTMDPELMNKMVISFTRNQTNVTLVDTMSQEDKLRCLFILARLLSGIECRVNGVDWIDMPPELANIYWFTARRVMKVPIWLNPRFRSNFLTTISIQFLTSDVLVMSPDIIGIGPNGQIASATVAGFLDRIHAHRS